MEIVSAISWGLVITLLSVYCTIMFFGSLFFSVLSGESFIKIFLSYTFGLPFFILFGILGFIVPEKWKGNVLILTIFLILCLIIGAPIYFLVY